MYAPILGVGPTFPARLDTCGFGEHAGELRQTHAAVMISVGEPGASAMAFRSRQPHS